MCITTGSKTTDAMTKINLRHIMTELQCGVKKVVDWHRFMPVSVATAQSIKRHIDAYMATLSEKDVISGFSIDSDQKEDSININVIVQPQICTKSVSIDVVLSSQREDSP